MSNNDVLQMVERGGRHPMPRKCLPSLYDIMLECWSAEASDRPTFAYLFTVMDDFFVSTEPQYQEEPPE